MKKKYKLIINFNERNQETFYFGKFTSEKMQLLKVLKDNYVLLYFDKILQCYVVWEHTLTEDKKEAFNQNCCIYCERY